MHKIEYYIDDRGHFTYDNKFDQWDGELYEEDHITITESIALWHAQRRVEYDLFPCDIELIINGKSVGVFNVELQPVPEFTAKRVENES